MDYNSVSGMLISSPVMSSVFTIISILKNYIVETDQRFYVNNARGMPVQGIVLIDNEYITLHFYKEVQFFIF